MKITEEMMKSGTDAEKRPDSGSQDENRSDGDSLAKAIKEQQNKGKRTEREKLRAMSGKDRRWYILTYYKFHILFGLLALVLPTVYCFPFTVILKFLT